MSNIPANAPNENQGAVTANGRGRLLTCSREGRPFEVRSRQPYERGQKDKQTDVGTSSFIHKCLMSAY